MGIEIVRGEIVRKGINANAMGGTEMFAHTLQERLPKELLKHFQIVNARTEQFEEDLIRIFCAHDLAQDPEAQKLRDPNFANKYHQKVFVSNWQFTQYQLFCGIQNNQQSAVIDIPVDPIDWDDKDKESDVIKLCYTSTPHRGLALLLPVFESLANDYPNLQLDVFSSFKIYGWEDADKQFAKLYEQLEQHPNINYHGTVPNEQIREYLKQAHIFAYPSVWQETCCRSLIEAMSAGLICVHPNYGALPETSGSLNLMYQYDSDHAKHAELFHKHLHFAIDHVNKTKPYTKLCKAYIDSRHQWARVERLWINMLEQLVAQYPDEQSRKFPEQQFVYSSQQ